MKPPKLKPRRKTKMPPGESRDLFEVINDVVTDIYQKRAIRIDTVILHPVQHAVLLVELQTQSRYGTGQPLDTFSYADIAVMTAVGRVSIRRDASSTQPGRALFKGEGLDRIVDLRDKLQATAARKKTVFVTSPILFLRRESNGELPKINEWSERIIRRVFAEWERVVVFWDSVYFEAFFETRPVEPLCKLPTVGFNETVQGILSKNKIGSLDSLEIVEFSSKNVNSATETWKRTVLKHGGRITIPKDVKESPYLVLKKFVQGDHISWVDGEGRCNRSDIKINLDLSKSFQDLAKERESRSNW